MPNWNIEIRRRLTGSRLPATREAEIIEELSHHLDDRYRELMTGGASEEHAAKQALDELAGPDSLAAGLARVEARAPGETAVLGAPRSGNMFADFWQDWRYAGRTLQRSPGFAFVAVLTLALGIGANTAIFSVIYTVLLKPLPFRDTERLVQLWEARPDRGWLQAGFSDANFWDVRSMNRSFDEIAALRNRSLNLTGFEYPERVRGGIVSAGFFATLGVNAVAGRTFMPGEDDPAQESRLALLSHGFWTRRFGADPALVGRSLMLDGQSYMVLGILPPGEPWLDAAEVFIPLVHRADAQRSSFELAVIGRLKNGVSMDNAAMDLDEISRQLAERYPQIDKGMGVTMRPATIWVASDTLRRALWILMGAVGFLLLIACVNLVNLLLAKATGRAREQALRAALGASRWRIARQMFAESLLVSSVGAGLGLAIAFGVVRLLRTFNPGDIPRLATVEIDGWILAFTMGAAIICGLVTGLVPAIQSRHEHLLPTLREGERGVAGDRRMGRLRSVLVGVEVALSLTLLVGAGLLLRSFDELLRVERGFQSAGRVVAEVSLPRRYDEERSTQFLQRYLDRTASIPQVASAAAVSTRPLVGGSTGLGIGALDKPAPADAEVPWASWRMITPDYFKVMGIPLLRGRTFSADERIGKPWRAVISKRLADLLWPGEDPIGRTAALWKGQTVRPAEVIGVVGDMRERGLANEPTLAVYLPYYGGGWSPVQFVVHTSGTQAALATALRSTLAEIDRDLPIANVRSLDEIVSQSVASRRFTMLLLASFACVALVLALAGIYGVLSYTVSRRISEIGVRVALGASHADVLRLVIGQGMRPVVIGITAGLAAAFGLSRLMTSLLYGVTPTDAVTYAGVAALLAMTAMASCYLPARQALRVNVVSALREE